MSTSNEAPARMEHQRGAQRTSLGGDTSDSASRRDIREVQPGEFVDPVESLAREIHQTAFVTTRELEKAFGPAFVVPYLGITVFDNMPIQLKEFCRTQARLLLERLNR